MGVLLNSTASDPGIKRLWQALLDGLHENGWDDGLNLILEARYAGADTTRFLALATELVALNPDAIVAGNTQSIEAVRRSTKTIPIIMVGPADPVGSGFVASLARPGGNITGLANQIETVTAKNLEVLQESKPAIKRVGIFYSPDNPPPSVKTWKAMQEDVAPRLGLTTLPLPVSKPHDIAEAFATTIRGQVDALLVLPVPVVWSQRSTLIALTIEQRLPAIAPLASMARDGLLMAYGYDQPATWRRAASYVDRILKGANPAELPVEQLDRFELIINSKTARIINFEVPPTLISRADELIE